MPIIKSAKKAARQAVKRTEHNKQIKKDIKAALKAFKNNPTVEALAHAQSEYDKAVKKNLLKKNTASRRKSKLHAIAKEAGIKLEIIKKAATKTTKTTKATKTTTKKPATKTAKSTTKKPVTKTRKSTAKAAA